MVFNKYEWSSENADNMRSLQISIDEVIAQNGANAMLTD
jgi:hypothetical protein